MSMNPIADVHSVYIEEVLKPQIAPKLKTSSKPQSDLDGDGDVDSFEKKVRQLIYDVRHLMRKNNIPVEKAFQTRVSKTNYGPDVIKAAKEKMGIKVGGTPVSEETEGGEKLYKIVIRYKNGTTYRKRTSQSEINRLRSNPNVSSVEKTEYAQELDYNDKKPKKLDPVGKEDPKGDVDNDGVPASRDKNDQYILKRREAVGKAIRQRRTHGLKESFSNWRQDLCEVIDDDISSKKKNEVKEMPKNKKNKVVICPSLSENINLIESVELTEDHLNETIDIATKFFYNCGLNENGVDIVIEELGEEKFAEFVFNLAEDYFLSEARSAKRRKGGKSYEQIKAEIDAKEKAKSETGKKITASKAKESTEKAKQAQAPSSQKTPEGKKTGIAGRVGAALGAVVKKGKEDIKRVQDAAQTARDVATRRGAEAAAVYTAARQLGKKAEQSATATRARRKATVAAGRAAQAAAPVVKKAVEAGAAAAGAGAGSLKAGKSPAQAAGKAAGTFVRKMTKEELELQEKAASEQQQKLFGLALSVKRGETPRSEASAEVLKIVDDMSEKKIRDFAKTKHEGIPKKVEEMIDPKIKDQPTQADDKVRNTQSDAVRKQQIQNLKMIQQKQQTLQRQKLQMQKSGKLPLENSYEPEGEVIDELNRAERETGINTKTGKPTKTGGAKDDPAFTSVKRMIRGMEGKPAGQRAKTPGQKPPVAGEYGAPKSPAQKVALLRASAKRAQDNQSSRFD